MLLDLTLSQLDIGPVEPEQAKELGELGYMQWLGALRPDANYHVEALRALEAAEDAVPQSPAVAAFCDLVTASLIRPPRILPLRMPARTRRGGSQARRLSR